MIKKIIAYSVVFFLIIAITLALRGYTRVELGGHFLALMSNINRDFADFTLAIPDIPLIDKVPVTDGWSDILNLLITFVNNMSSFINICSAVINVVLSVLQFIVLLVKNLISFVDTFQEFHPVG